jgi:hypothetical protein
VGTVIARTLGLRLALVLSLGTSIALGACSSSSSTPSDPVAVVDAGPEEDDASPPESDASDAATKPVAPKPTGMCASTFGNALTAGFGRADGIVYAIQKPSDTMCVFPNSDHVIDQELINGSVYRMVVNVQSDRAGSDPKIRVGMKTFPLPPPAFEEGWHLGAQLDYVATLDVHSDATFTPLSLADAVAKIASEVKVGDPVAVYAVSGAGRPESTHLVHRNKPNQDGAIVVNPTSTSRFLLFHFDTQTF